MTGGQSAAVAYQALASAGRDDLCEALDALLEAAQRLAHGGFAVQVDGALLARVFDDAILLVRGAAWLPPHLRQPAAGWLDALVGAVSQSPTLLGEVADDGGRALQELLAQGGDPFAPLDLRPDPADALGSLIYAQLAEWPAR